MLSTQVEAVAAPQPLAPSVTVGQVADLLDAQEADPATNEGGHALRHAKALEAADDRQRQPTTQRALQEGLPASAAAVDDPGHSHGPRQQGGVDDRRMLAQPGEQSRPSVGFVRHLHRLSSPRRGGNEKAQREGWAGNGCRYGLSRGPRAPQRNAPPAETEKPSSKAGLFSMAIRSAAVRLSGKTAMYDERYRARLSLSIRPACTFFQAAFLSSITKHASRADRPARTSMRASA
ncbi:hypothetical protein G6F24_014321 [Rhizopus arrhizus]|nr:hypothetical protein G6F24_014321 [Rhizopus arrhizus]